MEIKWIDITLLRSNSYNPNRLSPEEFKGLVEGIQNAGYCEQNPILARPLDGYFEIVDGEHRWRACLETTSISSNDLVFNPPISMLFSP